eukprot:TRINITY_DN103170_c0_g1_i1.p1 TRINITY_DN103170_c0_g1~~TRINITY_DN103170_c0_g1_i1.p1  ORF type:complete len:410 (+),score=47.03 TRINITY_DN103170_c0_g1_i1:27-1232(+)
MPLHSHSWHTDHFSQSSSLASSFVHPPPRPPTQVAVLPPEVVRPSSVGKEASVLKKPSFGGSSVGKDASASTAPAPTTHTSRGHGDGPSTWHASRRADASWQHSHHDAKQEPPWHGKKGHCKKSNVEVVPFSGVPTAGACDPGTIFILRGKLNKLAELVKGSQCTWYMGEADKVLEDLPGKIADDGRPICRNDYHIKWAAEKLFEAETCASNAMYWADHVHPDDRAEIEHAVSDLRSERYSLLWPEGKSHTSEVCEPVPMNADEWHDYSQNEWQPVRPPAPPGPSSPDYVYVPPADTESQLQSEAKEDVPVDLQMRLEEHTHFGKADPVQQFVRPRAPEGVYIQPQIALPSSPAILTLTAKPKTISPKAAQLPEFLAAATCFKSARLAGRHMRRRASSTFL